MKVTKIIDGHIENPTHKKEFKTEQLEREFDYFRAEKLLLLHFDNYYGVFLINLRINIMSIHRLIYGLYYTITIF